MNRRSPFFARLGRALTVIAAGALLVSACGTNNSDSNSDSTNDTTAESDRDRNVPIKVGGFGDSETGVASVRLGDFAMGLPLGTQTRQQSDGSYLVMANSVKFSTKGVGIVFDVFRFTADRQFDQSFGTNGVLSIRLTDTWNPVARLTRFGSILVLSHDKKEKNTYDQPVPVGVRRFNALTGQLDTTFGTDGAIAFDDQLKASNIYDFDEGPGSSVLVLSSPIADSVQYTLTSFVGGRRAITFGLNSDNGSVGVPVPILLGSVLTIGDTLLNVESNGDITVAFAVAQSACLANTDQENCPKVPVRRGIVTQQFDSSGSPMLRLAEESGPAGDGIMWVDEEQSTTPLDMADFGLLSIADDETGNGTKHTISVIKDQAMIRVYRVAPDYSHFDTDFDVTPSGLLANFTGTYDSGLSGLPEVAYLPMAQPVLVSIKARPNYVEDGVPGQYVQAYDMRSTNEISSLRYDDYPYSMRRTGSIQQVAGDSFFNVSTLGMTFSNGTEGFENLWAGRGFLKLDQSGRQYPAFSALNGVAPSPLNGKSPFSDGVMWNSSLLAGTGNFFYSYGMKTAPGEPSGLRLQRYVASGGAGAMKDGSPVDLDLEGVSPRTFTDSALVFDGSDAVYFIGFRDNKIGVAKALLSTKKLDASYGVSGFVALNGVEVSEPGEATKGDSWFDSHLQLNADGSVDIIDMTWVDAPTDESELEVLAVRTRHLAPNGATDLSKPATYVTTDPDELACSCGWIDARFFASVAVDNKGRVAIAHIGKSDDNNLPGATIAINRFNTDGTPDPTFGNSALTNALGSSVFFVGLLQMTPQLAAQPNGDYLVAFNSIGFSGDPNAGLESIVIDGEYQHVLRLDTAGAPINVNAPAADPDLKRVVDEVTLVPPGGPSANGIAAQPSADASAAAAGSAAAPLPEGTVQISPDNSVRITLATSIADRAVDVRWSIPASLSRSAVKYTVTASPGGKSCTTSDTSCVFKKLDPWTAYTFKVKTVSAAAGMPAESAPSQPVKPVRVLARKTSIATTKLLTPASTGKATWRVGGGCTLSKDAKTFTTTKDAAICSLAVSTAKSGKTPKSTRTITVVVRAVAK